VRCVPERAAMDDFFRDVRYSTRLLLKSPAFTVTAVAALAVGIGATTAIFSIVNTVLLKPLPVPDPDRFVVLSSTGRDGQATSPAKFAHYRAQSTVIQDVSAFHFGVMNYADVGVAEPLQTLRASGDIFRCFGMTIVRGRAFTPNEDLPNGPRVVLLSSDLWKRRFAGDPQILGKTILLSGESHTVIGIVGNNRGVREFESNRPPVEVYVPFQLQPGTGDQGDSFQVVARLKPGVTLEQARARLAASAGEYRAKYPVASDLRKASLPCSSAKRLLAGHASCW
jgi:hypothetical protein